MKMQITEKGKQKVMEILVSSGSLQPNLDASLSEIHKACEKYMVASRSRGDARTEQETRDAVLISLFNFSVLAQLKQMN